MSTVETTRVLDKIHQRAYWSVVIHPSTFDRSKIPYNDLFSIIERRSVRYRGWDYPAVYQGTRQQGPDWVGLEYEGDFSIEAWRLHTNGLFIHHFAPFGEWRDESKAFWKPAPNENWTPCRYIYFINIIFSFVEIFEFAARLALSPAGSPRMRVDLAMHHIQGRQLVSEEPGRQIRATEDYRFPTSEWKYEQDFSQTELIARPRDLAAEATRDFFARFDLEVSLDVLKLHQEKIGR